MRIYVIDDGTTPTWGPIEDLGFYDLPTDDPAEVEWMLAEIATTRGSTPSAVEHVIIERPND